LSLEPLLKWTGSKRKLAPVIQRAYDCAPAKGYVEPFAGAACVFGYRYGLDLDPQKVEVVLGDDNARLMAFYRLVRGQAADMISELAALPSGVGWKRFYPIYRAELNTWKPGPIDVATPSKAALFLWLNRASFNGLYRVNAAGDMNAPAGSYETLSLPPKSLILDWQKALQPVALVTGGYADTARTAGKGWQVYMDPPYLNNYDGYTPQTWSFQEQVRVAMAASEAVQRGCHVIASNAADSRLSAVWYGLGFRVRAEQVRHSISASAEGRKMASEVLFIGGEQRRSR